LIFSGDAGLANVASGSSDFLGFKQEVPEKLPQRRPPCGSEVLAKLLQPFDVGFSSHRTPEFTKCWLAHPLATNTSWA